MFTNTQYFLEFANSRCNKISSAYYSTHTHKSFISKPSKNIKEKKYREGMLSGNEVSKDSYHSPVKNKNN